MRANKGLRWTRCLAVFCVLLAGRLSAAEHTFSVLEAHPGSAEPFIERSIEGTEVTGAPRGARRRVPALSQFSYPEPASACGPVAVLNWLLWLDRYGLLKVEGSPHRPVSAGEWVYEIEKTFREIRGKDLRTARGYTHPYEIAAAMDRIVKKKTGGALRLAPTVLDTPLKITDLIDFMRGYRCGMLITRIVEDASTGELGDYHAVNFIAADRRGGLMVNNWGEQVYGFLRNEPGGQYFRSQNAAHPTLKIDFAICFIPIEVRRP